MNRREAIAWLGRAAGIALAAGTFPVSVLAQPLRQADPRTGPPRPSCDLLLRGGLVLDGTGTPGRRADVAITGDRITAVGHLEPESVGREVDCTGLVIMPGIVNIHSHTFERVFSHPGNHSALLQGITTEVGGVDGRSPLPMGAHLDRIDDLGPGANYAMLVGHGAVRAAVMGHSRTPAGSRDISSMQRLVSSAMDQGAFGLSNALEYVPDIYSSTPEIVALASEAARFGGHYATHLRSEGMDMPRAVDEALEVGARAGIPVHISHLKVRGAGAWYMAGSISQRLVSAAAHGDLTADIYPYLAPIYTVNLSLAGAWNRYPPENLIIKVARDPQLRGRSLAALAASRGLGPDRMAQSIMSKDRGVIVVAEEMREEHMVGFLRQRWVAVSNDASARPWYTAESDALALHPRTWGTFPRLMARYVRDLKTMTLEEAVYRCTGLPARVLGLSSRGLVRPGCAADIVVLNPDLVEDRATWHNPQAEPSGILHVMVNGRMAVRDGQLQPDVRAGRSIRRA